MAKLYWAEDRESTYWDGPHDSIETCRAEARAAGCEKGQSIWVAPIDAEHDDDDAFWAAVAQWMLWSLDDIDERLAEEGWLDPEEPWLSDSSLTLNAAADPLADALRKVLPPRPEWRTVDTSKAERVEL